MRTTHHLRPNPANFFSTTCWIQVALSRIPSPVSFRVLTILPCSPRRVPIVACLRLAQSVWYLNRSRAYPPIQTTSGHSSTFTAISGLFVINNESGWYEGWMIHDLTVAPINNVPRNDGHAQFGTILKADADLLRAMGNHNNTPGNIFTTDGNPPRFPNASDHFPNKPM